MPNCFQLFYKDGAKEPAILQDVDARMCEHFGVPVEARQWHHGWYNYIGLLSAIGWSFDRLRQDIDGECLCSQTEDQLMSWAHMRDILDWIDARFTLHAWAER